jgi:hypothetical protein
LLSERDEPLMSIDLDAMGLGNLGNRFVVDRGGDPQLLAATVLHK